MGAAPNSSTVGAGPISPELVLVDPELRQAMGSPGPAKPGRAQVRVLAPPAPRSDKTEAVAVLRITAERLPSRRTWRVGILVAAAVAAVGFGIGLVVLEGTNTPGARQGRQKPAAPQSRPHKPSSLPETRRAHPRPTRNLVVSASRGLHWKRFPHATFYDVVLVRRGSRVLDVWPRRNELSLAALKSRGGRRLTAGRYQWFVYPGFGNPRSRVRGGTFYGKLSARGVLTISR